jgi:hypothetical protein
MMTKAQYQKYLQTPHWWKTRDRRLEVAGHVCEFRPMLNWEPKHGGYPGDRCTSTKGLAVHHRHYDSLGREEDSDLEVLCRFHHLVRHASTYECPTCCDSWDVFEEDAIAAVETAVQDAGTPEDVLGNLSCSYCSR